MPVAAAGTALIKALGTKEAVKSTAKFAEGMKSMMATMKGGGLDAFKDGMDKMNNFATSFKPIATPFQVMTAQIQAGTMGTNMELMIEWFKLLESPASQNAMKGWIDFVNGVQTFGALWTAGANTIINDVTTNVGNFFGLLFGTMREFEGAIITMEEYNRIMTERLDIENELLRVENIRTARWKHTLENPTDTPGMTEF